MPNPPNFTHYQHNICHHSFDILNNIIYNHLYYPILYIKDLPQCIYPLKDKIWNHNDNNYHQEKNLCIHQKKFINLQFIFHSMKFLIFLNLMKNFPFHSPKQASHLSNHFVNQFHLKLFLYPLFNICFQTNDILIYKIHKTLNYPIFGIKD